MDLTRSQAPRAGAALFTWQTLVPAFGLGCLALRHFWPALGGLLLLWFVLARLADCRARPLLLALSFAVGLAAAHAAMPAAPQATPDWMLRGEKARVEGVVEAVEGKPGREARVILNEVRCRPGEAGWRDLPGKLAWTWREPVFRPKPGDRLAARLRVKPQRGFAGEENWDLRFYWARQGVFWRAWSQRWWGDPELLKAGEGGLDRRRADIAERVAGLTPNGQGGALAAALATGDRFGLDRETVDLFRQASLAHSLALSGLHLGLAAGLGAALAWLAARLRPGILLVLPLPKLAVLCGLPLALAYLWLGGAGPSLVRAFLMFTAWGGLLWLGRPRGLLDGLLAAVALILLLNPLSVFDLGLRLSVVAVAGILAGAPLVRRGLSRLLDGRPAWLRLPALWLGCLLGVSLCANIALLPLLLHSFGVIHANLLWNAVWLPLLGAAVMPLDLAGLALAALPGAEEAARWCLAGAGWLCGA
ncbi:ComEC/Rec2 family competence protein [Desulfohalovibrio reitneri]|uniref:ComEC/Rec2 family competence protein n=1 Tax=Desulfohalovibrio reitneri TaxID=1307759 RepID=UPI00069184B0|nr:ComEC/Rec2 family competence protein [Desulfohalovibrio reitneri]